MSFIFFLLAQLLQLYTLVVIGYVTSSWLVALGIVDLRNPNAAKIIGYLNRAVEPVLAPIRRFLPAIGGFDLSPVILIFGIMFVQKILLSL